MTTVSMAATATTDRFSVSAEFDADGGITALFGPSGAGKSLTLATIAGLVRPSAGTVHLRGTVVADPAHGVHVRTQDRRIGMVFQDPSLLTHRSPLDNVALAIHGGSRTERRARAAAWLETVDAGHLAHARTTTLSGGEQQRIALARAMAGEPDLLLLDEPFSALDFAARRSLRALVRRSVLDYGFTALLVTHDLDDIVALASRVVVFEPGRSIGTHPVDPGDVAGLLRHVRLEPGDGHTPEVQA